MATIYSSTNDGKITRGVGTWVAMRGGATGTADSNNYYDSSMVMSFYSLRGGGTWAVIRAFFDFDTSAISTIPDAASLNIYGRTFNSATTIVVRSTHSTPLANGDLDALYNSSSELAASDGAQAGSLASVSGLTYSAKYDASSWSTSGYNIIPLTTQAKVDMVGLSTFKVCLMEYDHDYKDVEDTATYIVGGFWRDNPSTGADPYLEYTPGTEQDNPIFFGTNF